MTWMTGCCFARARCSRRRRRRRRRRSRRRRRPRCSIKACGSRSKRSSPTPPTCSEHPARRTTHQGYRKHPRCFAQGIRADMRRISTSSSSPRICLVSLQPPPSPIYPSSYANLMAKGEYGAVLAPPQPHDGMPQGSQVDRRVRVASGVGMLPAPGSCQNRTESVRMTYTCVAETRPPFMVR